MPDADDVVAKGITVTKVIVVANIIIFFLLELIGDTNDSEFMIRWGALYAPNIMEGHEYYRLVTAMFLHFGIQHVLNNMLLLFFLGDTLERAVGKIRFIIIYFGTGIVGNLVSLYIYVQSGDNVVSAGASGAIFGVLGGLVLVVLVNKGRLEYMTFKRLIFMVILSLYFGFTSSGVNNYAHVAGLLSGVVLTMVLYRKKSAY